MSRPGAALAAAALLAAAPAAAYERSCPEPGRPCLHWNRFEVAWSLNPAQTARSPSCTEDAVEQAALAAFAAWEQATRAGETAPCPSLALPYAGRSAGVAIGRGTEREHLVVIRSGWCSDHPDASQDPCHASGTCGSTYNCFDDGGQLDRGTLAVTLVRYEPATGHIVDADVEVAGWSGLDGSVASAGEGWYYTCFEPAQSTPTCSAYGQAGCVYEDLQNTLTHEAGHLVGLAHPPAIAQYAAVTMYPTAPPREIQKRTLAEDDVEGVCTVYPAGRTLDGEGGGCACRSGGAGALALLAVVAALLPRGRPRRAGSRPPDRGV